jgi:predicted aspartyl protease
MKSHKSWDFGKSEDPPFPQIEIFISPHNHNYFKSIFFKIDTGFTGALGINPRTIKALDLKEIGSIPIQTAIGRKNVSLFPLKVKNPDIELPETLLYAIETPRSICGRIFLRNRIWLLDCENQRFHYCNNYKKMIA